MATRAFLGAATLAVVAAAATLAAPDAAAQLQRTFVTPGGNDGNACSLPAPCRTFARAIAQTLANGEIVALESGAYGAVDVTKSVSIIAPDGVYAGVTVAAALNYGVRITGSNLRVVLRNLQINGQGGAVGVWISSGSTGSEVYLERVTISNLSDVSGAGVLILAAAKVSVKESIIRDAAGSGIVVETSAGGTELAVESSRFERNATGVSVYSDAKLTVVRSAFAENAIYGAIIGGSAVTSTSTFADSSFTGNQFGIAAANGLVTVRNSTLAANGWGLRADTGATFVLDGNTIAGNNAGVYVNGGVVRSAGTNAIRGNINTDVSGVLTGVGTL
jgi:hypothetical protein